MTQAEALRELARRELARREAQRRPGRGTAALRGGMQGVTLGASDEMVGNQARRGAFNLGPISTLYDIAEGVGGNYGPEPVRNWFAERRAKGDEAMARERRLNAAAQAAHPLSYGVGEVGGSIAAGLPLMAVTGGAGGVAAGANALSKAGMVARAGGMLRSAAGGAATGAAFGGITGYNKGANPEERAQMASDGALGGALFGGGAGALAPMLTPVVTRAAAGIGQAAQRGGRMVMSAVTGRPVTVGQIGDEIGGAMAGRAQGAVAPIVDEGLPEVAARRANAERFGVPLRESQLVKGTAAGRRADSFERAALAGGRGESAQDILTEAVLKQDEALAAAERGLRAGAPEAAMDRGELIRAALAREFEASRAAYQQAYGGLREIPGAVRLDRASGVIDVVDDAFRRLDVDPTIPIARQVPDAMNARAAIAETFDAWRQRGTPVTPMEFEQLRRGVAGFITRDSTPKDKALIMEMRRAIDDYAEQATDLFDVPATSAEAFAGALQSARGLYRTHMERFGGDAAVGRALQEGREGLARFTPEEILSDALGRQNGMKATADSLDSLRQLRAALGDNPEALAALRAEALERLTGRIGKTVDGDRVVPAGTIVNMIDDALDGNGRGVMAELFEPKQLEELRAFRDLVKLFEGQPHSGNPSGSGYEVARAVRDAAAGRSVREMTVGRAFDGAVNVLNTRAARRAAAPGAFRAVKGGRKVVRAGKPRRPPQPWETPASRALARALVPAFGPMGVQTADDTYAGAGYEDFELVDTATGEVIGDYERPGR